MHDYVYTLDDHIHCFRFLDKGDRPFHEFAGHIERTISTANQQAACLSYLLDLRLAAERVPIYEVTQELRAIARRHPDLRPVVIAIIAHDTPVNCSLTVTIKLLTREQDSIRLFKDDDAHEVRGWLSSF